MIISCEVGQETNESAVHGRAGADLDQVKIVNSQGKNFKYLSKSGNIFENRNKIGKFRIFLKVYYSSESASEESFNK